MLHSKGLAKSQDISACLLRTILESGRIAHAYFFKGPQGSAKNSMALDFARSLLCENPGNGGIFCGKCRACSDIDKNNHPDLHIIDKDGTSIKIKSSHEVLKEAYNKPYGMRRKVFIIRDAESLTEVAANAMLKILEEPPEYVTFILISSNPAAIPETVLSRCQMIPFKPYSLNELRESLITEHGLEPDKADYIARHSSGSMDRAMRLAKTGGAGQETLEELQNSSPLELAMKVSKMSPTQRFDYITEIEVLLANKVYGMIEGSDNQEELNRCYLALMAVFEARERLHGNTNAFLSMSVMFLDLKKSGVV